jgi:hypothetical protein
LNRTSTVGDHLELECDVTSSPQPKIIWKKGNKIVQVIDLAFVEMDTNSKIETVAVFYILDINQS